MQSVAPPIGGPTGGGPPVPAGWVSQWNDQHRAWFYVNTQTGVSQWEPPPMPVYSPVPTPGANVNDQQAPAPVSPTTQVAQDQELAARLQAEENNQHGHRPQPPPSQHSYQSGDEAVAARLQAEENARGHSGGQYSAGQPHFSSNNPYAQAGHSPLPQQHSPFPQQQNYAGGSHPMQPQYSHGSGQSPGGSPYPPYPQQHQQHQQQQYGFPQQQQYGQPPQHQQPQGYGYPQSQSHASQPSDSGRSGLLGKVIGKAKNRLSTAGIAGAGAGAGAAAGYGASQHQAYPNQHAQQPPPGQQPGYPGVNHQPTSEKDKKKKNKWGLPVGAAAGGAGLGVLGGAVLSKLTSSKHGHGHGHGHGHYGGGHGYGGHGYGHHGGGFHGGGGGYGHGGEGDQTGHDGGDASSVSSSDPGGSDYSGGGGGDFGGDDGGGGDF